MLETVLAYVTGFAIGVIMGLVGGGASLLLPTMAYLLHKDIDTSTAYSLILGGITALFGALPRWRSGLVDFPTAVWLGIPIVGGTLLVRGWLLAEIPDELFQIGGLVLTKKSFTLILFALMLFGSYASMTGMIGKRLRPNSKLREDNPGMYFALLMTCGFAIGIISALIGGGGGVMMVPLMVVFFGLEMKKVIGTVLTIIAGKSVFGLAADIYERGATIEWDFLALFSLTLIAGSLTGTFISRRLDNQQLKTVFAWFILLMAIVIFSNEIFFAGPATN